MILDLRDVFSAKRKSVPVKAAVDLSDYDVNGFIPIKNGVMVDGELQNNADVVSLKVTASFDYTAPCDRCAIVVMQHFSLDFSHIIVNELFNDDNDDFIVSDNMRIDLDEIIRTDVILSLPFKFLCSEDCKGVCTGCGVNLNEQKCTCQKQVDPRLSKLDEFISKND